jgi:hypothetical protein
MSAGRLMRMTVKAGKGKEKERKGKGKGKRRNEKRSYPASREENETVNTML